MVSILVYASIVLSIGFIKTRLACKVMGILLSMHSRPNKIEWLGVASLLGLACFSPFLQSLWAFKKVGMLTYYSLSILALNISSKLVHKLPEQTFSSIFQKIALFSFADQLISTTLFYSVCAIPTEHLIDKSWVLILSILISTSVLHVIRNQLKIKRDGSAN